MNFANSSRVGAYGAGVAVAKDSVVTPAGASELIVQNRRTVDGLGMASPPVLRHCSITGGVSGSEAMNSDSSTPGWIPWLIVTAAQPPCRVGKAE
jgi:hypothetical protein